MGDVKLDDIVRDLTKEQIYQVAEFQAKVIHVQNLPSFDHDVLQDPKNHVCANTLFRQPSHDDPSPIKETSVPLQWNVSIIKTQNFAKAIGNLAPQTLHEGMWKNVKHDDPDTLVVRHLKARNWDVDTALLTMFNSVQWRTEFDVVDGLLGGGDLKIKHTAEHGTGQEQKIAAEVLAKMRSGKSFAHGFDRQGRPLLFMRVQKHNPRDQGLEGLRAYTVFQAESARMIMRPPVTTVAMIFDLGGFSMSNMDWNAIRLLTAGLEDKYPASMGATYVYRAPWIIGGIWNVVKSWMPGTEAQKVTFVRDAEQLSQFVDLKYLPADMGGTGDFEYSYTDPVTGENDQMEDKATRDEILHQRQTLIDEYEALIIEWFDLLQLEASRDGLYSVGKVCDEVVERAIENATSSTSAEAMRRKQEAMMKLRENYFALDPYVRGKCHRDRVGGFPIDEYSTEKVG